MTTGRKLTLRLMAITSFVPAVIHFAVAGAHFQEFWIFGVLMLLAAWLQATWALGLAVRPSRPVIAAGAAVNLGVIAVYVITRTVGDVIGPTPRSVEPIGFGDAFCTASEAALVLGALLLLVRRLDVPVPRVATRAASASGGVVLATLLSFSLVDGGPEMVMDMSSGTDAGTTSAAASVSLPTTTPAGPITMPDPSMQMMPGMKMASGGSCTEMPTAGQKTAAVDLVDASWAGARKYQSPAAARTAGYRPLTPAGRTVVHYINPAYYRAIVGGAPVLDTSEPQSLVYANTPKGAVLVAAMYITSPNGPTPRPGGCLTQWHVHTNLCVSKGLRVVSVLRNGSGSCPSGSSNRATPAMLHVWFVPIPGGPTAIDASDSAVVRAAEQVSSPHNGPA
jgi:hypothetical protein